MPSVNLRQLVSKLNGTCRRALEAAAGLCVSRTNRWVEVEHWLAKLIEESNTDLAALFRFYEVDTARLSKSLTAAIDRFQRGHDRTPGLAPNTVDLAREAWLVASLEFASQHVRSGHLLLALLTVDELSRLAEDISTEFAKISPDSLRKDMADICADTAEAEAESAAPAAGGDGGAAGGGVRPGAGSKTPSLDQYTIDLTARAKAGKVDPVLGRDSEVRQIVDILTRRRQNNPILTGEAGVGKTAVVEGFAQRIADGDVPPSLQGVMVRTLDLGLLQAGAGVKGEFENRLKGVIDEVKGSPQPIILFIDEAHTLIGAGGQAGQGDAANMLKPALARGELRTIAATTWAEYKKYFEKDAALARRFQVVKIEEPSEPVAVEMMRGLVETLEKHHAVRVLDEAVVDAVKLSHRYITGRQLPDKAVSLLDTACARVGIGQSATPPAIEDARRRITQLGVSVEILERETLAGADHSERIAELTEQKHQVESELEQLEARWSKEKELVGRIRELRHKLEGGATRSAPAAVGASVADTPGQPGHPGHPGDAAGNPGEGGQVGPGDGGGRGSGGDQASATGAGTAPLDPAEREKLRAELDQLNTELHEVQGESPLMGVCVDSQSVAEVVSAWTGIPVGRMVTDEIRGVLNLRQRMEERIIGQSHALETIAQSIRTSRARLGDPRKPIGVFLFVGSSGVGKTETAIALAELMYGSEQNMTTINMSEFKEEHKVSLLMGSPPGYVGYGEGGVLTEAVRRKPYSVVLLDEMEKAHSGVQDIFYQVFDKGTLKDGEGRDIDFKNSVIIMTSNAATDLITKLCSDPDTRPDADGLQEAIYPELLNTFKPAFLGRVSIIPFFPLDDAVMRRIIELQLNRVSRRVRQSYKAKMQWSDALIGHIADRCHEVSTGARNVDHILTRTLLPEMAAEFLTHMAEGRTISRVNVDVAEAGFRYEIE